MALVMNPTTIKAKKKVFTEMSLEVFRNVMSFLT